jgi:hypothetical protein
MHVFSSGVPVSWAAVASADALAAASTAVKKNGGSEAAQPGHVRVTLVEFAPSGHVLATKAVESSLDTHRAIFIRCTA